MWCFVMVLARKTYSRSPSSSWARSHCAHERELVALNILFHNKDRQKTFPVLKKENIPELALNRWFYKWLMQTQDISRVKWNIMILCIDIRLGPFLNFFFSYSTSFWIECLVVEAALFIFKNFNKSRIDYQKCVLVNCSGNLKKYRIAWWREIF